MPQTIHDVTPSGANAVGNPETGQKRAGWLPRSSGAVEDGRSYRWIARDLGISKNTGLAIVKRDRGKS